MSYCGINWWHNKFYFLDFVDLATKGQSNNFPVSSTENLSHGPEFWNWGICIADKSKGNRQPNVVGRVWVSTLPQGQCWLPPWLEGLGSERFCGWNIYRWQNFWRWVGDHANTWFSNTSRVAWELQWRTNRHGKNKCCQRSLTFLLIKKNEKWAVQSLNL